VPQTSAAPRRAGFLASRRTREGALFLLAFIATIPLANWMLGAVGTVCPPDGPCLIPVAPGLMAPSGVVMVGLALTLRDLVQRRLGLTWGIAAILIGGALSWFVAPPALVIASVVAFLVSEFADLAVFTPLQKRGLVLAVVLSSVVGILVDSALFLALAFGDLSHFWGQAIGKGWMVLLAIPFIHLIRRRDDRLGLVPRGVPA
jgi:queuosine precursor transporter